MFGHLNAEEFMNLIETGSIAVNRQKHLSSCASCKSRLQSSIATYHSLAVGERDIPEPDWADFRNSVRTSLLSRSVQRESAIRRWTGWSNSSRDGVGPGSGHLRVPRHRRVPVARIQRLRTGIDERA